MGSLSVSCACVFVSFIFTLFQHPLPCTLHPFSPVLSAVLCAFRKTVLRPRLTCKHVCSCAYAVKGAFYNHTRGLLGKMKANSWPNRIFVRTARVSCPTKRRERIHCTGKITKVSLSRGPQLFLSWNNQVTRSENWNNTFFLSSPSPL